MSHDRCRSQAAADDEVLRFMLVFPRFDHMYAVSFE
jgi:hypothetical protein